MNPNGGSHKNSLGVSINTKTAIPMNLKGNSLLLDNDKSNWTILGQLPVYKNFCSTMLSMG